MWQLEAIQGEVDTGSGVWALLPDVATPNHVPCLQRTVKGELVPLHPTLQVTHMLIRGIGLTCVVSTFLPGSSSAGHLEVGQVEDTTPW